MTTMVTARDKAAVAGSAGLGTVLAVCAHPDDESFGLGGVLSALTNTGSAASVLCFTHGEASTLGAGSDLGTVRAEELGCAASVLGLRAARLLDYPDGHLADAALDELVEHVRTEAHRVGADTLLVFDQGGITGHPDHRRATAAALVAAEHDGLAVLAWAVPREVASSLNDQFGTAFAGRDADEVDVSVPVDRDRQLRAIACHASQSDDNPVLWRRLELLGHTEHLRYLRPAGPTGPVQLMRGSADARFS